MTQHHIQHEEGTVGKGEYKPKRLPAEPYIRQEPSTPCSEKQRNDVSGGSCAQRGKRDGAQELDGPNGP